MRLLVGAAKQRLMGKILIVIGLILIGLGLLVIFKVPIPFGNLPGDISIQGKNFQIYFPIVTCILLSIVLSFIFYFFRS